MERWTELALGAGSGNREDLEILVDLAYEPTRRLCATLVDSRSADDLVQETFLRMAAGIDRFRGKSSARTWLFSIAYRVCASEARGRVRRRHPAEPGGDLTVARRPAPDDPDGQFGLGTLLQRLDPDRRAAFAFTQLDGLSYAETAAVVGCARGTVARRVVRARQDLIELMGREDRAGDHRTPRPGPARVLPPAEVINT